MSKAASLGVSIAAIGLFILSAGMMLFSAYGFLSMVKWEVTPVGVIVFLTLLLVAIVIGILGAIGPKPAREHVMRERPADWDATVAVLRRRGRDHDMWHAELRELAKVDEGYRGMPLHEETLVRIAADTDAPIDARDAAAIILGARGGAR